MVRESECLVCFEGKALMVPVERVVLLPCHQLSGLLSVLLVVDCCDG